MTLFSLDSFYEHARCIQQALETSIEKMTRSKMADVQKHWYRIQARSRGISIREYFKHCVESPLWNDTPLCINLHSPSTYISFDAWWSQRVNSTVTRNYDAGSVGMMLHYINFFSHEDTVSVKVLEYEHEELWDNITVPDEAALGLMVQRWTTCALWSSKDNDSQQASTKANGLRYLQQWYDAQILVVVREAMKAALADAAAERALLRAACAALFATTQPSLEETTPKLAETIPTLEHTTPTLVPNVRSKRQKV